jgi:hypothetical protein
LIGLTADVDIDPSTDLLGKTIEDLQSGVSVNNRRKTISGNIKYVTGYTGFSGDPAEQEGNYLCVHFATEAEDTTITVAIIGGDHGPVTLDPDGILVARIKNTDQKLQVTATKDGAGSDTVVYTLRGLNLANS